MTHSILAQAPDPVSYWPLGILAISVGFIVFTIIKLKLHPFLALIFAAVLTGLLTGDLPGMTTENVGLFKSRVTLNDTPGDAANDMLLAVNWSLLGFGNTAAGIGFVVALAAIIGTCMLGSGAADRVVRWLLGIFGEKRAGLVLLMSGFLLSIPVFFDTVFFLLIPLARALSLRTGKSYTLFVMAMAGAGAQFAHGQKLYALRDRDGGCGCDHALNGTADAGAIDDRRGSTAGFGYCDDGRLGREPVASMAGAVFGQAIRRQVQHSNAGGGRGIDE